MADSTIIMFSKFKYIILTAQVVILFIVNTSSGDPNIFNYFDVSSGNHEFMDAYNNFMTGYEAATIDHKDHLDIIGYQIYRYSNAKLARP